MDVVMNGNKKLLIIVVVVISLLLSSTYAFLSLNSDVSDATGEGGCFEVEYSADPTIVTSSLVSTVNVPESPILSITISKDNSCKIYSNADIYIHTNMSNNETTAPINDTPALKYKIFAKKNSSGEIIINKIGNITTTLNADGTLNEDLKITIADNIVDGIPVLEEAITYDIYIWVDKNASLGRYNNTTYSGYIYAEAHQTSTIK